MKHLYFILAIFALLACEQKPMEISRVEDDYAKQNGGIPNENIFLIEHFKNDREGIKAPPLARVSLTILPTSLPHSPKNNTLLP